MLREQRQLGAALCQSPGLVVGLDSAPIRRLLLSPPTLKRVGSSGTTLLLVAAAILWLIYLVPLWLKRNEYYATERNATRLGQTLRLLANTTEASEEIKAELKARSIAKKEREAQHQLRVMSSPELSVAERRRRTKQVFSLALLLGLLSASTAYIADWPLQVIWASSTVVTLSLAILGRVNRVSADAAAGAATRPQAQARVVVAEAPRKQVPLVPAPLSVRSTGENVALPTRDELIREARRAALAHRPEDFAEEKLAVVSQFAAMGHIEPQQTTKLNLDEVLQRRRAV